MKLKHYGILIMDGRVNKHLKGEKRYYSFPEKGQKRERRGKQQDKREALKEVASIKRKKR